GSRYLATDIIAPPSRAFSVIVFPSRKIPNLDRGALGRRGTRGIRKKPTDRPHGADGPHSRTWAGNVESNSLNKRLCQGGHHGQSTGEWAGPDVRWRSVDAADVVSARRPRTDRDEIRLRRGAVRRLYRPSRRRSGAFVRRAHVRGRRKIGDDHRGARSQGRTPSPGGLAEPGRAAMRLLSGGPDHAAGGAAGAYAGAERPANPRCHERQSLSLRLLSAHPSGGPRRLQGGVT